MTTRQFLVKFTGPGSAWTLTFSMFFSLVNGEQICLMSVTLISFTGTPPANFTSRTGLTTIDSKQDLIHFLNWKASGAGSPLLIQEGLTYTNFDQVNDYLVDYGFTIYIGEEVIDEDSGDKVMLDITTVVITTTTTTSSTTTTTTAAPTTTTTTTIP